MGECVSWVEKIEISVFVVSIETPMELVIVADAWASLVPMAMQHVGPQMRLLNVEFEVG